MYSRIVLVIAACVLVLAGCGGAPDAAGTKVVAAFYPLAYAAEQVGDGSVEVRNLTPPGSEPHDVELTARDVGEIEDADLVLYLGGGFQPAVERAVADRSGPSLDLLAGQPAAGAQAEMREADPHVWLDPVRFAQVARAVARALGDGASAGSLVSRLNRLDRELRRGLDRCKRQEIVTSHAAFGYLAERYGLTQLALTGISPEVEPTPRALERLVREVRASGATTVFFEPLVSPELAQTVARESGVATAVLDPIEGLTDDQVAAGEDYLSVMRANLAELRKALGCR